TTAEEPSSGGGRKAPVSSRPRAGPGWSSAQAGLRDQGEGRVEGVGRVGEADVQGRQLIERQLALGSPDSLHQRVLEQAEEVPLGLLGEEVADQLGGLLRLVAGGEDARTG